MQTHLQVRPRTRGHSRPGLRSLNPPPPPPPVMDAATRSEGGLPSPSPPSLASLPSPLPSLPLGTHSLFINVDPFGGMTQLRKGISDPRNIIRRENRGSISTIMTNQWRRERHVKVSLLADRFAKCWMLIQCAGFLVRLWDGVLRWKN